MTTPELNENELAVVIHALRGLANELVSLPPMLRVCSPLEVRELIVKFGAQRRRPEASQAASN